MDFTLKKWLGNDPSATFHNVHDADCSSPVKLQRLNPTQPSNHSSYTDFFWDVCRASKSKTELEAEMVKAGVQVGEHTIDYLQGQGLEQEKDLLAEQVTEARRLKWP